jgi:NAD(P)-dependent dehydrogenase (short-subunit alcohol dehydrogenase family)
MDLQGRTAVVTGAASGIGLALTERCLAEGMSVVMADIEADALAREAKRLEGGGASAVHVVCDVSDPDQIESLRDRTLEAFGGVHLLCNNAGVASGRRNIETKPAVWQWVVGVNLLGAAYGVSAFAPVMLEQGEGHIVNTASEAGLASSPMLGAYHASKYGVVGLSESLAMELDGTGVGVSCLCPELVDTKIFESTRNAPAHLGIRPPKPVPMATVEQWMNTVAMNPADVAAAVLYAVRANRFWIITHQVSHDRIRRRNADLETGRNPRAPGG